MHATIHPRDVLQAIRSHLLLLTAPIVMLTVVAVVYALLRPSTWEASQALVVRNESSEASNKLGAVSQLDEMKNTQETILELAKNRSVLTNALVEVGRPANDTTSDAWPSETALEDLQDSVSVSPPKGAEFGKTEVFYLKVKDHDRHRAVSLNIAICKQLQKRLSALRESTSRATIEELEHSQTMARQDLAQATDSLGAMEQSVGNDLVELRILSDKPSGDSDLRRNLVELDKELRAYKAAQVENEESLKLLQEAQADPQKLIAAPSLLLKSQPALARLKDGLVDAQLRSGQALGTMSEDHPLVRGAREAERVIREQVYDEIAVAIKGAKADLNIGADRIHSLEAEMAAVQARLARLVALRAGYANLTEAVKSRTEALKTADRQLAEARAGLAAAVSTSRISAVEEPDTGTRPIGPGKSLIAAGGMGAGVMISAAILFLLVHPTAPLPAAAEQVGEPRTLPLEAAQADDTQQATGAREAAAVPDRPVPDRLAPDRVVSTPQVSATPRLAAGSLTIGKALRRVAG